MICALTSSAGPGVFTFFFFGLPSRSPSSLHETHSCLREWQWGGGGVCSFTYSFFFFSFPLSSLLCDSLCKGIVFIWQEFPLCQIPLRSDSVSHDVHTWDEESWILRKMENFFEFSGCIALSKCKNLEIHHILKTNAFQASMLDTHILMLSPEYVE